MTPWEIVIDALQWATIAGLSFALFQQNKTLASIGKRLATWRAAYERLYQKTNGRLAEHIKSRMH